MVEAINNVIMKKRNQSKCDEKGRQIEMSALYLAAALFGIKKVRHRTNEILFNHSTGKTFKVNLN